MKWRAGDRLKDRGAREAPYLPRYLPKLGSYTWVPREGMQRNATKTRMYLGHKCFLRFVSEHIYISSPELRSTWYVAGGTYLGAEGVWGLLSPRLGRVIRLQYVVPRDSWIFFSSSGF